MKVIKYLNVLKNSPLPGNHFLLTLSSGEDLPSILPGQFAQVKIENSPDTFLRRPFSIHDVDYEHRTITLFVKCVGEGTQTLSQAQKKDTVNVIFPLGNTFTLSPDGSVLLIGGGCGIAPLYYLCKYLRANQHIKPDVLIGGRTRDDIVYAKKFSKYAHVHLTTEDGSIGEKGMVTDHSVLNSHHFDRIYSCGPKSMIKAIVKFSSQHNIETEVSLENTMACGIGACLCCVTETHHGNQCVCTQGPVFNIKDLKWEN